ncbi:MAG: ATP-dependent Clp protease adapter ClpS [Desulfoarculaceae bacterium]|nr:ATP-dependent Clp protease adapter ClpS [Desulfoarculaceae bacterium]
MSKTKDQQQASVATREREEIREPSLYKALLHNDDYTSMEFVVVILEHIFGKTTAAATRIMLDVHQQGVGVAGIYTREICETKIELVHHLARKNGFPLRCSLEKV